MTLDKWVNYNTYLYKSVQHKSTKQRYLVVDIDNTGMCVLRNSRTGSIISERLHIKSDLELVLT